jgi:Rieske Fe-S protein
VTSSKLSRRSLLLIGSSALGAHALGCGGSGGAPLDVQIDAGLASALQTGTLRALSGKGVAVGRDAGGIYAMTLICTHEGCDISTDGSVSASGIECFCHGARFDAQGTVTNGPARSNLIHFAVTQSAAGELTIHTDQQVAASARTT